MVQFYQTQQLTAEQKEQIFNLWNSEYPTGIMYSQIQDFDNYLEGLADKIHVLLLDENHYVKGWMAHFNRADDRWFAMILDRSLHRKGYGRQMLNIVKRLNLELNGWVVDHDDYSTIDGEVYNSPLKFYLQNGFEIVKGEKFEVEGLSTIKVKWKFDTALSILK